MNVFVIFVFYKNHMRAFLIDADPRTRYPLNMLNAHTFKTARENAMSKLNKITALAPLAVMALGLTFTGCMEQSNSPSSAAAGQPATISMRVGLDPVQSLGKASLITLKALILQLSSNTGDTIRDTLTTSTTPGILGLSTAPQTVSKNYTLKPLRSWKVIAKTWDLNDSVIHIDTVNTGVVNDGDTAHINVSLSSRFTMYQAQFMIPDSISSSVSGTVKQVVNINRLELMIDGVDKKDSTVSPGPYYTKLVNAVIGYDYVPVGNHTVQLFAYGVMYAWPTASPLYSSSITNINNVLADSNATQGVTLNWTGPTTNTGAMTAIIGQVGTVTLNGSLTNVGVVP